MFMSMGQAATGIGHIDISGLLCLLSPWWCLGPCCHRGPRQDLWSYCSLAMCWCLWPVLPPKARWMSTLCALDWIHVDVCGLCCRWVPCQRVWPELSSETTLMSVACAEAEGHVDVCGLYCCQKPRGSPWSLLPLTIKGKEASFAVVLMITDSQLRMGDTEGLWENLSPPSLPPN